MTDPIEIVLTTIHAVADLVGAKTGASKRSPPQGDRASWNSTSSPQSALNLGRAR